MLLSPAPRALHLAAYRFLSRRAQLEGRCASRLSTVEHTCQQTDALCSHPAQYLSGGGDGDSNVDGQGQGGRKGQDQGQGEG